MRNHLCKASLILLILVNSIAAAAPLDGALILEKGAESPYRGVLMTETMARDVYNSLVDYDKVKLINESLVKSVTFYQENEILYLKEITELRTSNDDMAKTLTKEEHSTIWSNVGYFVLGVLVTGVISYGARH